MDHNGQCFELKSTHISHKKPFKDCYMKTNHKEIVNADTGLSVGGTRLCLDGSEL